MKTVIGIIGKNASGKTTITKYLETKYGAETLRFSDMLGHLLDRLYLDKTRQNYQMISTIIRQNISEDIMSRVIAKDVEHSCAKLIIAEGIRRPSDTVYLKKIAQFYLISIDVNITKRYKRLQSRNEKPDDATKSWEEFQKEELKEAEQKIDEIASQADFVIDNNGTLDKLYSQIDEIVKKIL